MTKQDNQEYIERLIESKRYSTTQFDKNVLLLASGALVISVGFLDKTIPLDIAIVLWILFVGWILLVLTILSSLLSHFLSMKAVNKMIGAIQDETDEDLNDLHKRLNKPVSTLNWISIILLILGILAIVVFTIINLT